jgi:hypothetical protein
MLLNYNSWSVIFRLYHRVVNVTESLSDESMDVHFGHDHVMARSLGANEDVVA